MNDELQQKDITITEVIPNSPYGVKVKDEKGMVFNVNQFKKDTKDETSAWRALTSLPADDMGIKGVGSKKCFKYVEAQNAHGGKSRYVRIIDEPQGQDTGGFSGQHAKNKQEEEKVEYKNNDIRENVALKMVSEIIASGKIEKEDWELWANKFYNYKPQAPNNAQNSPVSDENPQSGATPHDELSVENIPF